MGTRANDFFEDGELDGIIDQAETNANNDFEMEFTSSIREKFDEWGENMFMSEKQRDILRRIAERD